MESTSSTSQTTAMQASLQVRLNAWLVEHLPYFNPLGEADEKKVFQKLKAFDELCLYVSLCDFSDSGEAVCPEIRGFVHSVCTEPRFLATAFSSSREMLLYVFPLIYIWKNEPPLAAIAQQYTLSVLGSDLYWSSEKSPHRMLDALFSLWMLEPGHSKLALVEPAWRLSNGTYLPHAAWSSLGDFYAFTHNVFFKERFGVDIGARSRTVSSAAEGSNPLDMCLDFGVFRFLAEANLDIALELVICKLLLGRKLSVAGGLTLGFLADSINQHGCAAGPRQGELAASYQGKERDCYVNYHTSLVALLALRLLEKTKRADSVISGVPSEYLDVPMKELLDSGRLLSDLSEGLVTTTEAKLRVAELISHPKVRTDLGQYLEHLPDFV